MRRFCEWLVFKPAAVVFTKEESSCNKLAMMHTPPLQEHGTRRRFDTLR
jgi:hypothetical protein